jgi:hypothetical protein
MDVTQVCLLTKQEGDNEQVPQMFNHQHKQLIVSQFPFAKQ